MQGIRNLVHLLLISFCGIALSFSALADNIKLRPAISASEDANMSDKVRDECQLQTKVPSFLNKYAKGSITLTDFDQSEKGKRLEMEITNVHAPGGGAWSGSK
jgi:hypothetical protein